jgi:hypothetical protein
MTKKQTNAMHVNVTKMAFSISGWNLQIYVTDLWDFSFKIFWSSTNFNSENQIINCGIVIEHGHIELRMPVHNGAQGIHKMGPLMPFQFAPTREDKNKFIHGNISAKMVSK